MKPNILLIMVDDMGYADLGCYGSSIETPNLDRLAANGLRYTQFCNTARCCPARAALLTGLYPHQTGMGWMTAANLGTDGYTGDLGPRCATIAEALKPVGYSTYLSGKWHLTYDLYMKPGASQHSWPLQRGFDRYFGLLSGGASYWSPDKLVLGNEFIKPGKDFYLTDAITGRACDFINEHHGGGRQDPWFLYLAYTAPHWPLHAHAADIARYRGKFRMGWDRYREQVHARQIKLGVVQERWGLTPREKNAPAWDSLSGEAQDTFDLRMAIYAAQLTAMDRGVGRVVETMKRNGALDNTLVLFLSDNGACAEEIHAKSRDPKTFGTADSFESYGLPWANASDTPFRRFKKWVHEGGIATPMIAHWPNGLSECGKITEQLAHITDFMPTCLEVAGAKYPGGLPDPVGKSLVPAFHGRAYDRGPVHFEHEGNRALRHGKWKLVAEDMNGPWELYDMEEDRCELNDLASSKPEKAREMAAEWERLAMAYDVFPLDGRGWFQRIEADPAIQSNNYDWGKK